MKVSGAGYPRTGTKSTKRALELLLGAPCYHMATVMEDPEQLEIWWKFSVEKQPMDWRALLDGFCAATDVPTAPYFEELMHVFPDAMVLLTVRDSDSWFESWNRVMKTAEAMRQAGGAERWIKWRDAEVVERAFQGHLDREGCIRVFEEHNARVRQIVPPERLLEMHVKEGWEPLCAFLDVPVPDEPFPHLNAGMKGLAKLVEETTGVKV